MRQRKVEPAFNRRSASGPRHETALPPRPDAGRNGAEHNRNPSRIAQHLDLLRSVEKTGERARSIARGGGFNVDAPERFMLEQRHAAKARRGGRSRTLQYGLGRSADVE